MPTPAADVVSARELPREPRPPGRRRARRGAERADPRTAGAGAGQGTGQGLGGHCLRARRRPDGRRAERPLTVVKAVVIVVLALLALRLVVGTVRSWTARGS